jgi:ELWxxDGT repeat protein
MLKISLAIVPLLLAQTTLAQPLPRAISTPLKLVKELPGGPQGLFETAIALDQTQLFTLNTNSNTRELWRTDGTAQGTSRLKVLKPDGATVQFLAVTGKRAFFQVDDNRVWQTNGTTVSGIPAIGLGTIPFNTGTVLGKQLLVPVQGLDRTELWSTNGLASKRIKQWSYQSAGIAWTPQYLTTVGNQTFFSMLNSQQQWRLGRTDGTTQGTIELPQVNPAAESVTPGKNRVYFEGETPEKGFEWWTSDGTVAGTKLLKDILPGPNSSGPRMLAGLGDRFFALANSAEGYELWVTQGTTETTKKVKRIGDVSGMADRSFFTHQNKLFFAASNAFWVTDGTTAGTQKLADLGQVQNFVVFKDKLYFAATGPQGMELWTSDGTVAGTEQVLDIFPGTEILPRPCPPPPPIAPPNYCAPIVMERSSSPSSLVVRGDRLYFIAINPIGNTGVTETSLWVSDGTSKGTKRVQQLRIGYGGSDRIIQVGAKLLVTGYDNQRQRHQIWQIPD